jgi:type I site-specific restriction-modification system R (restriction) subunit
LIFRCNARLLRATRQGRPRGLSNGAFIGFTGTPLMAGKKEMREIFDDYLSVHNFARSIEDGATVPALL